MLLRIAYTLLVTSCENERAHIIVLLKILCNTMVQERLSSLVLMHIYYHLHIDFEDVIDRFKLMHDRRISL